MPEEQSRSPELEQEAKNAYNSPENGPAARQNNSEPGESPESGMINRPPRSARKSRMEEPQSLRAAT